MQDRPSEPFPESGAARQRRALGSHVVDLGQEVYTLLQKEVELGTAEIGQKVDQAEKAVGSMVVGGAVLFAGLLVLLFSATYALALVMPLWLSALLVGGAVALVGAILVATGRSKTKTESMMPKRTVRSVRDSKDAVRGGLQ